jgi:hypothetical protein
VTVRRRVLRSAAAALVCGAAVLAWGIPSTAQEAEGPSSEESEDLVVLPQAYLDGYGWFNKANQVPTGGKPAPNPPSCPSSPASDCSVGPPADGLYVVYDYEAVVPPTATGPVANAPTLPTPPAAPSPVPSVSSTPQPLGPSAFGAVRFVVPEGAESQLTLRILSRSTTTPGGTDPTVGKLFACLVSTPGWLPAQNARYDEGPKYDCTTADEGDIQGDVVVFDLGTQFLAGTMVDVAIVPAGDATTGDRPFQMALAAPSDDSLVLVNAADLAEASGESLSEEELTFEDPLAEFEASLDDSSFELTEDLSFADDAFLGTDTFGSLSGAPVARPSVRASRPQVAVPAGSVANPFARDASRADRLLAVGLLLAIATGLWWVGGRPVRPPRLLGSLSAGGSGSSAILAGDDVVPAGDARARGIGRFARQRPPGPAPRLL